jgi:hypothetical protein
MNLEEDPNAFSAVGDPRCAHRSHYECVSCRKMVCARCGSELAASTDVWRTTGYWCPDCRERKTEL